MYKEHPRTRKRGDAVAPDRRVEWMSIEIKGTGNTVCLEISEFYVSDLEPLTFCMYGTVHTSRT